MTVNPALVPILEAMAPLAAIDWNAVTADAARSMLDQPMPVDNPLPMARVENIALPLEGRTINSRLYVPAGVDGAVPLTVFFHGGGFVIGTLETHDSTCRELADGSGSAVLSVEYRLAPETPYPGPLNDCYDALVWASENGAALGVDTSRLAVAGDSAGGNFAATVAILARDRGGPKLRHQLLIYPVTDADFTNGSNVANGSGEYFLSTAMMKWFMAQYLGETKVEDAPLATPLRTPNLEGLPSATVFTAEFDPLRDEGNAYAARLAEAGIATDHATAQGMIHGFFSMTSVVPDAKDWVARASRNLAAALA